MSAITVDFEFLYNFRNLQKKIITVTVDKVSSLYQICSFLLSTAILFKPKYSLRSISIFPFCLFSTVFDNSVSLRVQDYWNNCGTDRNT